MATKGSRRPFGRGRPEGQVGERLLHLPDRRPARAPERGAHVRGKSVVARQRSQGKIVILQGYDVSKYFDKEMIEDGVITCLRRGADPKAVRLWYKINEGTRIQVRTGAGMTKFGEVGAVIGQGMIGGALVSQAVLDDGVMEHIVPGGDLQME